MSKSNSCGNIASLNNIKLLNFQREDTIDDEIIQEKDKMVLDYIKGNKSESTFIVFPCA